MHSRVGVFFGINQDPLINYNAQYIVFNITALITFECKDNFFFNFLQKIALCLGRIFGFTIHFCYIDN